MSIQKKKEVIIYGPMKAWHFCEGSPDENTRVVSRIEESPKDEALLVLVTYSDGTAEEFVGFPYRMKYPPC